MSISANNKMLNMDLTIKQLNDKHQLNPNNTGIKAIDKCMCIINNSLGISTINGIHIHGQRSLFQLELSKDIIYIPATTKLLCSDGTWVSLFDDSLKLATKLVKVDEKGVLSTTEVWDIRRTDKEALTYTIQTQRGNYVLDNGLVVKSD